MERKDRIQHLTDGFRHERSLARRREISHEIAGSSERARTTLAYLATFDPGLAQRLAQEEGQKDQEEDRRFQEECDRRYRGLRGVVNRAVGAVLDHLSAGTYY